MGHLSRPFPSGVDPASTGKLRPLEAAISRREINPLRPLTENKVTFPTKLSQTRSKAATRVARAALILAVAHGDDYQQAIESVGRRSDDAVSHLVACFNTKGLAPPSPSSRLWASTHL